MPSAIHVVSKRNNAQSAVCSFDDAPTALLAESSVRVRTTLISMTTNNLSYARGGSALHWWDAYPVPDSAPAPFNDGREWGIVPAWGYAEVIESTIESLKPGSFLYGLWPTSSYPVNLRLEATEPADHWLERSPHRARLMTLYNRYEQMDGGSSPDGVTALFKSAFIAAFLLNNFVFTEPSLHPFGTGAPWSEADADLSSAVVVSLSASSKTGRAFSWNLARNRDGASRGPLALLQLSSSPDSLPRYDDAKTLPTKSARYDEPDAMAWVSGARPKRIVIVDFGAPKAVGDAVSSAASGTSPGVAVTYIAVGAEAKIYSDAELAMLRESAASPGRVMLNTSALRDRAMELMGPVEYFRRQHEAWTRCHRDWGHHNLQLQSGDGVGGAQGIEETGKGQIEVKMEEDAIISRPDPGENATAQMQHAVAGPEAASPAPSNASSSSRPPYIPQFSAATQMILQRINGKSGSLSSALSSASAVAKTIEQSTFEDAKRRLVMNMNTSLTMPLPTPPLAPKPPPSSSLPVNDAFQLRTPTVAKPASSTSKGATKVPAKRGRPPKGIKRKRAKDDHDDSSSLSDLPISEGEDALKDQATPTMTKSGRQVQKPSQYNPSSSVSTQKRKHHSKRTPEQALCKLCHDPYIDDGFVSNETRSWFCNRCLAKRERHLAKKKTLDGFKGKRAHLSTVPHGQLVNILMYSLELHPDLPIFPTHETGPAAKRSSHGLAAGPTDDSPFPRADASLSGPIHYACQASAPGTISVNSQQPGSKTRSGPKGTTKSQERAMRETSVDSIPASWPKAGQGCLAGLDIKEDDLQDKDDFEAFSVTTYDSKGRKVMENGMPVKAIEDIGNNESTGKGHDQTKTLGGYI
ncbi:hypothetical protein DL766_008496 [Monosporascus sp. MC13-8B]|nr:hypothetical protein DL766_008496 [Monosporascus sp. MC13-8B]